MSAGASVRAAPWRTARAPARLEWARSRCRGAWGVQVLTCVPHCVPHRAPRAKGNETHARGVAAPTRGMRRSCREPRRGPGRSTHRPRLLPASPNRIGPDVNRFRAEFEPSPCDWHHGRSRTRPLRRRRSPGAVPASRGWPCCLAAWSCKAAGWSGTLVRAGRSSARLRSMGHQKKIAAPTSIETAPAAQRRSRRGACRASLPAR